MKNTNQENTSLKTGQRTYWIAVNAIVAALYASLTIAISPIAYGEIQFRVTEMLIFLAFYNKRYIPGLIIGCFLANLLVGSLPSDIVFGTLATLLGALVCAAGAMLSVSLGGVTGSFGGGV